jgi:hypothetical protein
MRKGIMLSVFILLCYLPIVLFGCTINQYTALQEESDPTKKVFKDNIKIADFNSKSTANNLNGESGTWEAAPEDNNQSIEISLDENIKMGEKGASLRIDYDVDSDKNAVNGFWTQLRVFDASPYDHFEFWVKGDKKLGYPKSFKIEFKKFEKSIVDNHEETVKASYVVTGVTDKWQKISIPLNVLNGIMNWKDIREFGISFEKRRLENKTGTIYIDDISFIRTGNPGPKITDPVIHKKHKTEGNISKEEFAKILIKRLKGFPREVFVYKEFPKDDYEFLMVLAKDLWKYFDNIVDAEYELPLDNISFSQKGTISDETEIGDYTNITNVGVYLMCVTCAYDLGFITREEAVRRLNITLNSIDKLAKHNGFPYNYYDITIFQETSNFISFVDSGWLAAGIIVVKNAFEKELGDRCSKMLDSMDFSFFYDHVEGHMYHGYYTNINYYSEYRYGAFYTEPRAISYIAIGKGDVSKEHWFMLARTFPDTWLWQTQMPKNRKIKHYLGYPVEGGYYTYKGTNFVPSWGGSMFEAIMPTLIIKEKELAKKGLGLNDERHVKIQIQYALEELGYPVFGMSPSSTPGGGYSEYGVKPLGMKGYKAGVITPHATYLGLEFAPTQSVENLRNMLNLYNAYGEYGFYDAIDVKSGKVAIKYLCLDQAMSFIALTNYLRNGSIRNYFHNDPIAKNAEELLKVEDFFE